MKNWVVLFALWLSPIVVFGTGQAIDYGSHYECEIVDGVPECYEKYEVDSSIELIPFAIRINNEMLTILSTQITSKSVRGRVALRDRLSRRVRNLFTQLNPGNDMGAFFDRPYLSMDSDLTMAEASVCDSLPNCLEFDNDTNTFFTEMERLGYGKTLITVIPRSQIIDIFITPDLLYSGIIPEVNDDEDLVVRSGNVGSWSIVFLVGGLIKRVVPGASYAIRAVVPGALVHMVASTGILVLVAYNDLQRIRLADRNTIYFSAGGETLNKLMLSDRYDNWLVFSDFYHVDLRVIE